jgi:hypothetical protein
MIDGTALYHDSIRRIQELQQLNARLVEQVDRMRPVVNAAWAWRLSEGAPARAIELSEVVDRYQKEVNSL